MDAERRMKWKRNFAVGEAERRGINVFYSTTTRRSYHMDGDYDIDVYGVDREGRITSLVFDPSNNEILYTRHVQDQPFSETVMNYMADTMMPYTFFIPVSLILSGGSRNGLIMGTVLGSFHALRFVLRRGNDMLVNAKNDIEAMTEYEMRAESR